MCRIFNLFRVKVPGWQCFVALPVAVLITLSLLPTPAVADVAGVAAPDDPFVVALLAARETAETHLDSADYLSAAVVLAESLRELPGDRTDLADAAYGNVLLTEFIMQYLMQYPLLTTFVQEYLDLERYPTDKYVLKLYHIFLGPETAEAKTKALREMHRLTSLRGKHDLARVMVLFSLSDPYFIFPDERFADQHVEILAKNYPDLLLTQVARDYRLYENHKKFGLKALATEKSLVRKDNEPVFRDWNASLRQRLQASRDAVTAEEKSTKVPDPLCDGMVNGLDWKERTFCLMFAKENRGITPESELFQAAETLATRTDRTPDVLMARLLLARRHGKRVERGEAGAVEACVYWANEVLKSSVGEINPERTLWEDRVRAIFDAAVSLKKGGHDIESERLVRALIDEYPGSLIADHCDAFLAGDVSGE